MTQRQEFQTLQTFNDFEIREYAPCVIAEVRVTADYSVAASAAFGSLFGYISKGNKASQKIAMTAPVISANKGNTAKADEWFISFVMPAGSTMSDMPDPTNTQVVLRDLAAEKCVAMSFRGKASEGVAAKKSAALRAAAARENIALSDETRICRFDPPFKPGIMQYNEIVIPLT
ncbi:MAG: hypothetical protein F2573_05785 [Actinobacteria bacterium]|uniref:Unannotated protein n=1 Tax=freshwater metagenome TaxID=449393 RepID=A0A6J6GFC7_9ZZZZ|nr:hypothetical protein [Actinomycetota bacterium]